MTPFMLRVGEIVGTPQDQLPELEELADDEGLVRLARAGLAAARPVLPGLS